ncbi:MAG: L-threonylcarbamoyladenylate synthase, partial [Candidatus Bathyarchaeia archaeon]
LVTGGGDKIGLRAPNHPVPLSIIRASRLPLIATSANKHGQPNPMTAEEAFRQLGEMVDLVIDAGRSEVPIPSTVIDLTQELPAIIREGPVSRRSIEAVIGRIKNNT